MKTLILGGVRSGKSRLAEKWAIESNQPVTYLATAQAKDQEMYARIVAHRKRRCPYWAVIEEPIQLAKSLEKYAVSGHCVLVDCMTLWLTNLLTTKTKNLYKNEYQALFKVLPILTGRIILVSNETNMGVIPLGSLSRRFCDEAGRLHQGLAEVCDQVVLTVAGLPYFLKDCRQ